MHTRNMLHAVIALLLSGATILSCSFVTNIFTGGTEQSPGQDTSGDGAGSGQSTTGDQGNSKPIVGTWKQVVSDGRTSAKNQQLTSHAELGGYHYFATAVGMADQCGERPLEGGAEIWRTRDGSTWETVVDDGLGNPRQGSLGLATWHKRLYVVAHGGKTFTLWVSEDGKQFRQIEGPWTNKETAGLHVIDGRLFLFAGTLQSKNGLQAWELSDREEFSKIFDGGLGDPTNRVSTGAVDLPTLDGWTYMGVVNSDKGGEVWRTMDGMSWERSLTGGFDNHANPSVFPHLVFHEHLYASYSPYPNGANVLRTENGDQWEKVVEDAFGLGEHHFSPAFLKEFENVLYLVIGNQDPRQCGAGAAGAIAVPQAGPAVGPAVAQPGGAGTTVDPGGGSGAKYTDGFAPAGFTLWKARDGKDWEQVGKPGFGDPNYFWAGPTTARGMFYLCATNHHDGNRVWRSSDGENWEVFFTAPVSTSTYGCAIGEVDDSLLYLEGDYSEGAQVWRYGP